MPQLARFDRATRTLVDDASGTIRYHPGAVEQSTAQSWFEALQRRGPDVMGRAFSRVR